MAIERIDTTVTGQDKVSSLDQEMGMVMDELNRGVDVTTIKQGGVTADKILIGSADISSLTLGLSMAPGDITSNGIALLVPGQPEPLKYIFGDVYIDYFVDPTDTVNLYNNAQWPYGDHRDKFSVIRGFAHSVRQDIPSAAEYVIQISNGDTVNHNYYCAIRFNLICSQLTGISPE